MSDSQTYFLPWLRRGLSTGINGGNGMRATAAINVNLKTTDSATPPFSVTQTLTLLGPGDVTGLQRSAVARVFPRSDSSGADPRFFCHIEFQHADLPWRFTPSASSGQLMPWLCLLALKDGEWETNTALPALGACQRIDVKNASALPPPGELWAWAHTQVIGLDLSGALTCPPGQNPLKNLLDSQSGQIISRVICPRMLTPNTSYQAFLVPAFASGLGLPNSSTNATDPSWIQGQTATGLPVYYTWRFSTGDAVDFESLISGLQYSSASGMPSGRDMDITELMKTLKIQAKPEDLKITVGGALLPGAASNSGWSFAANLRDWLNSASAPGPSGNPTVAPPLYGLDNAGTSKLGTSPRWFWDVNSNPEFRAVARLGASVVASHRNELMAAAWAQVEGLAATNENLQRMGFANAIAQRIYGWRLTGPSSPDAPLSFASVLCSRVAIQNGATKTNVKAVVESQAGIQGILDRGWRRLSGSMSSIAQRLANGAAVASNVASANSTTTSTTPVATSQFSGSIVSKVIQGNVTASYLKSYEMNMAQNAVASVAATVTHAMLPVSQTAMKLNVGASLGAKVQPRFMRQFRNAPNRPGSGGSFQAGKGRAGGGGSSAASSNAMSVDTIRGTLVSALEPKALIAKKLQHQLLISPSVKGKSATLASKTGNGAVGKLLATPTFDQPLYVYLKAISQDWILPGVGQIPPETVLLLNSNPFFIEAFMLGANHEMARELRWNGYPVAPGSTFFRHFWEPLGNPAPADITDLSSWQQNALGFNHPNMGTGSTGNVALVIRSELFKRYPNTVVYAAPATQVNGQPGPDESNPMPPSFCGKFDPDISFFGFAISETDAKSGKWYFVIQEQPSETKFGRQEYGTLVADQIADTTNAAKTIGTDTQNSPANLPEPQNSADMAGLALYRLARFVVRGDQFFK